MTADSPDAPPASGRGRRLGASSAGKSPDALRAIGEVVAETGIAAHVLRYWERTVPALRPVRQAGGRRYYRREDIELVRRLHRLVHGEGYTLEGAARAVRGKAVNSADAPVSAAQAIAVDTTSDDLRGRVRAVRDRLQAALASD